MPENAPAGRSPEAALYEMISGMKVTQALYAAVKLNVFELLRDGPQTTAAMAAACGAQAPALRRLLRFLTMHNVLTEDEQGRFAATPLGELLRSDQAHTLRPLALLMGDPIWWRSWGEFYHTLITGQPGFDLAYGEAFFAHLSHAPEAAALFDAVMTSNSRDVLPAVLAAYDFSGFGKFVDVAGGQGALLRGLLERYPAACGTLFETAEVVAEARELRGSPVEARCDFVAGDMFQSLPAGGDAYLLKHIIHDWTDQAAIQILRNCRQAINPQGKVILVEQIVQPSNRPDPAKWVDVDMLVMVTGHERTAAEFEQLYAAAGFALTQIVPAGEFALIEGSPI